jgi:hypothetical protein
MGILDGVIDTKTYITIDRLIDPFKPISDGAQLIATGVAAGKFVVLIASRHFFFTLS